jgi:hypothetical protein
MSSSDMTHITHPKPTCEQCHAGMALNGITHCADGYDLCSYRCFSCRTTFLMVEASTPDRASPFERRALLRHRVINSATIGLGDDATGCMVRDLSAAGAGLDLTGGGEIPRYFIFIVCGSRLPSHVVWRKEKRIGIAFD